jgi:cytochrome c peroxidase
MARQRICDQGLGISGISARRIFALLNSVAKSSAAIATVMAIATLFVSPWARPADSTVPLGLPQKVANAGTASSAQQIRLGRKLFNDARLSADGAVSCVKCHLATHAFADGRAKAIGAGGRSATRNTPSLFNVAYSKNLFWDGRVASLEEQARSPLLNPLEQGLPDERAVERILRSLPEYASEFRSAFGSSGDAISMEHVTTAIAAYERTLLSGNSPFDRFYYDHQTDAISVAARRGLELFRGRAGCTSCHLIGDTSALFTDQTFHTSPIRLDDEVSRNLAALTNRVLTLVALGNTRELNTLIASDKNIAALGRFVRTLAPADIGKYQTPSLRNVALTAPYMHDGSVATLAGAVELELYSRGMPISRPIALTSTEKEDIVEFLGTLTGEDARRQP